eukprot:TRINITY_DN77496_c0_g1_i1.p1 TRINITY_DN77496_c0_g1~~TRINITY_DN77496_c0_g1_i1.p1  ORF type:complete len:244 (-),score=51.52 TRINITY_DN77496_c0_g1_i1:58-789(-)
MTGPTRCFEARSLLGADEAAGRAALEELAEGSLASPAEIDCKAFSDCSYLSCKSLGIQLRFKPPAASGGLVDVIFLYSEGVDGFSLFQSGELPEGLMWSQKSRDVIQLLGEPSDKFGGGRFAAVGISYETLGLDIQFKEKSWDDEQNPIAFVSIFQGLDPSHGLCELCGKLASFRCGLCKLQRYCSSKCQKADWIKHQKICSGHVGKASPVPSGDGEELLLPRCQQAPSRPTCQEQLALDAMD